MLFTSIPFDKGWTVKVDGEKVETRKAFGAFLAIDVSAGDHVIDFSYVPKGLKTGGLISGGSIVILILLWFLRREMDRREARKRMEQIRNMQQEAEDDPDEEPEFEEIPDLDDEDLTDTINNRKATTEEQL